MILLLASCAVIGDEPPNRCRDLEVEVRRCLGVEALPLPCDQLSNRDVDSFEGLIEQVGCTGLQSLVPLDGDPLAASCVLVGHGCSDSPVPPLRRASTRHPLVLVNGIDVSPLFSWSDRIVDVLRGAGHDPHLAVVPPFDDTVSRSRVLWRRIQEIRAETGARKVNLLCHSLGGLDCRYTVSPAGLRLDLDDNPPIAESVASVTTVGTAHMGTPVADIALGLVPGDDEDEAIDALATTFGAWFSGETLERDVDLRSSLGALTTSQAIAFNAEIVDARGVVYRSWAGFSRPFGEPPDDPELLRSLCAPTQGGDGLHLYTGLEDHLSLPLLPSYDLVGEQDDGVVEPNDGLCPVRSARWGDFRGCIPIDHQEQLGRGNLPDANVRNHVDVAAFYADLAADLAEVGL